MSQSAGVEADGGEKRDAGSVAARNKESLEVSWSAGWRKAAARRARCGGGRDGGAVVGGHTQEVGAEELRVTASGGGNLSTCAQHRVPELALRGMEMLS